MVRRVQRSYSPQFKAAVVLELLTGQKTAVALCREHQIGHSLLATWKQTYLDRLPVVFQGESQHSADQARIAELEPLAGRQALELEVLKKAHKLLPGLRGRNGRPS